MRTTRVLLLLLFVTATFLVLTRAVFSKPQTPANYPIRNDSGQRSFLGFFYYNTPFTLFPPNAAISLTEDNSTSFAARPAAFGPKLANTGLSGPLWVGSGFGEDDAEGTGELGCSDEPGWEVTQTAAVREDPSRVEAAAVKGEKTKGGQQTTKTSYTFRRSWLPKVFSDTVETEVLDKKDSPSVPTHADIQSLQESAEIQGKVALLMRGGCGFLQKVMWAQRRGAIAVIVGDNTRGGPLVQMYASSEDSDGVTIPSVFTAKTTAQLLSSLTQPGSLGRIAATIDGHPPKQLETLPLGNDHNIGTGTKTSIQRPSAPTYTPKSQSWIRRMWNGSKAQAVREASRSPEFDRIQNHGGMGKFVPKPEKKNENHLGVSTTHNDLIAQSKNRPLWERDTVTHSPSSRAGALTRLIFDKSSTEAEHISDEKDDDRDQKPHDGLWVTITPTSGASPFFDTLLVLVISPLVTLSVVYALLILRARIRRRRWRAPKSVIERLPVRTYHTVAASPSQTSRSQSPARPTPTTPLLQRQHSGTRPRSRTTTDVPEIEAVMIPSSSFPPDRTSHRLAQNRELGAGGFSAEWKKYMGRQVECVVCLEEYIDGVSRVMSLPCGHEFHAECM